MQNIILFIIMLLQTYFFTYSSQKDTFEITFFNDAASKKECSRIVNYELWTFSAVICKGDYILLYDDHEKNIPTALLCGESSDLSSVESFEDKKIQDRQYKINGCSTLITRLHHWNKKDANFCIELWSPTNAVGKRTLFIKDCIDRRSVKSASSKNKSNAETIQALIPFMEKYLVSPEKIQDKQKIPQPIDQGLSSTPTQPAPICDKKTGGQQQNAGPKKPSGNIDQSVAFNANLVSSIPVYKTKIQGSSDNHKSTPIMVPPVNCSGIFYEEENIIVLEQENTNSLIVICSEVAVNTEKNKGKLIQTIVAKNNKPINYIITATPMGRCTSLLFEEGAQQNHYNINSRYLAIMSDSQNGNNFCFAVNSFRVIESSKPGYIKRMQPILTSLLSLAGIGLGVYICGLIFHSIKSKLYS